jgi:hypothetical protein
MDGVISFANSAGGKVSLSTLSAMIHGELFRMAGSEKI